MDSNFQIVMPFRGHVRRLVIANVLIWIGFVLILSNFVFHDDRVFQWFGFVPGRFFTEFWVWQPFTYMFLHANNVFHILFNMLMLWWVGAELETYWGSRYFLFYYLACGVGAALIYCLGVFIYYWFSNNVTVLIEPMIGASGAIFGLLLAYGLIFGERVVLFLMLFPMKVKYFVMIIGGVSLMNLLSQGPTSQVADLAHLGGILVGWIILKFSPRLRDFMARRGSRTHGRKLKLVVDNDKYNRKGPSRYWN